MVCMYARRYVGRYVGMYVYTPPQGHHTPPSHGGGVGTRDTGPYIYIYVCIHIYVGIYIYTYIFEVDT